MKKTRIISILGAIVAVGTIAKVGIDFFSTGHFDSQTLIAGVAAIGAAFSERAQGGASTLPGQE